MTSKRIATALGLMLFSSCGATSAPEQGEPTNGAESPQGAPTPSDSPGAGTAAPPTSGLRIATWNLEWLNRKNGTGPVKRSDEDYARLRRYADRLDADVIAIQEVDGPEAAARVFDPAKYELYVAAQNDPQRTGFAYRKGLHVSVHPDYAALDVGQVRVGADISVEVDGRVVRLLSVHLKSGCFQDPLTSEKKECKKLVTQLPSLEAWIDTRAKENAPAIVLGDFNRRLFVVKDEPFWREIDDSDPPASDLWSPTEGQKAGCWGGKYPDFIDHIVLNKPATQLVQQGSFHQQFYDSADASHKQTLSDHCPLSVALGTSGHAASGMRPAPAAPSDPRIASANPERIKGNISSDGRKLYHAPGCPDYERTQIDEGRGERWFDSRAEAEAAGWMRASSCH